MDGWSSVAQSRTALAKHTQAFRRWPPTTGPFGRSNLLLSRGAHPILGAPGGTRTPTPLRATGPKPIAAANFATSAVLFTDPNK